MSISSFAVVEARFARDVVRKKMYFATEVSGFWITAKAMDWADRICRRIKIRDLHVLRAVAETGTMVKAAAQLGTSHPVISKTVSDLEKLVGVRLLERSVRGAELTSQGKALLHASRILFDDLRQGLLRVRAVSDPDAGELRIGCPEAISAGVLPAAALRFAQKYPRARLEVIFADTARGDFEQLKKRHADLLIGPTPSPLTDADLQAEDLFMEQFVAVAGLASPLARRRSLRLKELSDQRWVLPPLESLPGGMITAIFEDHRLPVPEVAMVNLSIHLTVALIASSQFVGLLPASIVQFSGKRLGLAVLPIKRPRQRRPVALITLRNRPLSLPAERFATCLRDVVAQLQ